MHPVAGVVSHVGQVHEQRQAKVGHRPFLLTDLGGDDAVHGRRQRRVAGGERVVVVEVAPLLGEGELVAQEEHRQHDVGLLEDLVAVDHQRVVVKQQRIVIGRGRLEVPDLTLEELRVLRVDPPLLVVGHVHGLRRSAPAEDLVVVEIDIAAHHPVAVGIALAQLLQHRGGVVEVQPGHQIGEGVVVDHGGVLVGTGDGEQVEPTAVVVEPETSPHASRFNQQLGAELGEHLGVSGHVDVALQGVGDVGVEVVLRRARLVVRRCLFAGDRAPREQRPRLVELRCPVPGLVQHAVAKPQQVPGDPRLGVAQERQYEDLDVPEVVAFVAVPAQALGGHAAALGPSRGLEELEQVPADRLLHVGIAFDLHVAASPEVVEDLPLGGSDAVEAGGHGPAQHPVGPVDQFRRRDASRRVVAGELGEADGRVGGRLHDVGDLAGVLVDLGDHLVVAVGLHDVVHPARQRHAAPPGHVAEQEALIVGGVHDVVEHPPVELAHPWVRLARPLVGHRGILSVHELGGDDHGSVAVQHPHLELERRQVAVAERGEPP